MSIRVYSLQRQKWLLQPLHRHIHRRDVILEFLILHAVNNNKKKLLSDLIATDSFSEPHLPLSWKVFSIVLWLGSSTSEYNDVYNYCILITHYIVESSNPVMHYVFMLGDNYFCLTKQAKTENTLIFLMPYVSAILPPIYSLIYTSIMAE